MKRIIRTGFIASLLLAAMILSACQAPTPTQDPALKITEIAATVRAEITQNAALTPSATATATITPTATLEPPTPTVSMTEATPTAAAPSARVEQEAKDDDAVLVEDTTIPDGTIVKPGQAFDKIWKVKNTGTTTWSTAYRLVYLDGLQGSTFKVAFVHTVKPAMTLEIKVPFVAPTEPGTYYSYWRMYNANLEPFGQELFMKIVVGNP